MPVDESRMTKYQDAPRLTTEWVKRLILSDENPGATMKQLKHAIDELKKNRVKPVDIDGEQYYEVTFLVDTEAHALIGNSADHFDFFADRKEGEY
jgi:hypothetical protein